MQRLCHLYDYMLLHRLSCSTTTNQGILVYEVENCVKLLTEQQQVEIGELNIQPDHVYALAMVPPKVSIFDFAGTVKGKTAIRTLK